MTSQKSTDTLTLTTVALELFKSRSGQSGIRPSQIARECLSDARSFLVANDEFLSGKAPLEDDVNLLDYAFAPNLKKTHPINLMSSAWGDLNQVEKVLADLEAEPARDQYGPLGWGKQEIHQAKALFPAVVNRIKQFQQAK